jgi:endogenous inhibitor of DNA gyrase (YacG/DUF329 family)
MATGRRVFECGSMSPSFISCRLHRSDMGEVMDDVFKCKSCGNENSSELYYYFCSEKCRKDFNMWWFTQHSMIKNVEENEVNNKIPANTEDFETFSSEARRIDTDAKCEFPPLLLENIGKERTFVRNEVGYINVYLNHLF